MLSKNEIKYIQSLGHKKLRDESELFVAEGPKVVAELIKLAPSSIKNLYATSEWIGENIGLFLPVIEIEARELLAVSQMKTPNQVLAVVKKFPQQLPEGLKFILYLDTIQDPGNLGTIIRTADWFGVKAVVCSSGCADIYNSKVVQASMASICRVPVYYDREDNWLSGQKLPLYATGLHGSSVYEMGKISTGILLIGNESKGIRKEWMSLSSREVTIPKKGGAESLNAAVAAGIMLSWLLPN